MWHPISKAPNGKNLLLFFPAERSGNDIILQPRIVYERYPVDYPRKPTLWMSIDPPDAPPVPYAVNWAEKPK